MVKYLTTAHFMSSGFQMHSGQHKPAVLEGKPV